MDTVTMKELTYRERIAALRAAKERANVEKQQVTGYLDADDLAIILPPPERRKIVEAISGSGMKITDCLLTGIEFQSNHPNGGFFGPKACGENFGFLLRNHPAFVDPLSSLAGAYMTNFNSYRKRSWKPELDISQWVPEHKLYGILPGIGAGQHFCQDLAIGLQMGWGGLLAKVRHYRALNAPRNADFYDGLEAIVLGIQDWIGRNAALAAELAGKETNPQLRANLETMAEINARLVVERPRTFREACQWMIWYDMMARMYNGSGSLGRLDVLLYPFYRADREAGILTDDEAMFHLACFLLRDTAYIQLGGPDDCGRDVTNEVSFLILEAAHALKIPANVAVCVGEHGNPRLLRRAVEILFEDRLGIPKFIGMENFAAGFARNGYPEAVARQRAYAGCHWCAIPGREYTVNDCVKINFAAVFLAAFRELMAGPAEARSVARLWELYGRHMRRAVQVTAEGLDFQVEHNHEVFPELVLDLLCHGPIETGYDASHGSVEFVNLCVDGSALATVADSFAAIEQRVEKEGRLSWDELARFMETDWAGAEGERARLMMKGIARYGSGGSRADDWALRVTQCFTDAVKAGPTPNGHNMIPGIFSWANTIPMGKDLGATPNGRHAGAPISHGANPDPGFRSDGAPTAMAVAIAAVQPGWGNSAPMQIELDPSVASVGLARGVGRDEEGVETVANLIRTHMAAGGTQINMNVLDKQQVLAAHKDPSLYPDLIVRVTGFSAYFNRLSPEFRQLVVDRIIAEN